MFMVLAAALAVQKEDPDGGVVSLALLRERDVARDISLLTGLRATATVSGTCKTAPEVHDRQPFGALLREHPTARVYLEGLSSRRLKQIGEALRPAAVIDDDELLVVAGMEEEVGV